MCRKFGAPILLFICTVRKCYSNVKVYFYAECGVSVKQRSNLRVFCHTFASCSNFLLLTRIRHVFALHAKVMHVYFIFGSIANLLFKFMSLLIGQI